MIHIIENANWRGPFSSTQKETAIQALESGKVLFLPELDFKLNGEEKLFLNPQTLQGKTKNISFDPNRAQLKGCTLENTQQIPLMKMMRRFVDSSRDLLNALLPNYNTHLITGRTSFRPAEIEGRKSSILKDDTRLHVDAFPSAPNQGKSILRVFTNINPHGQSRHWNLGEPFETVLEKFQDRFKKPIFGSRKLQSLLKITKSYRSLYDHYMLLLHNHMKRDQGYQETVQKHSFHFPAGSSWIVMTDRVSHAALKGQYVLEQTFYLPINGMRQPELSTLGLLERQLGQKLA